MGIKKHEYMFESSGVKVFYRLVNPLVAIDVRTQMKRKEPQPPMETVMLAGVETEQPNEDDPDYVKDMEKYDLEVQKAINEAYVRRSKLVFEYDGWQEEVAEYRADIGEISETDEWVFLTRVIGTQDELMQFYSILAGGSNPSEEATAAARDSFPA